MPEWAAVLLVGPLPGEARCRAAVSLISQLGKAAGHDAHQLEFEIHISRAVLALGNERAQLKKRVNELMEADKMLVIDPIVKVVVFKIPAIGNAMGMFPDDWNNGW